MGSATEYLGMKIFRDRKRKLIIIDQIEYAKKIVNRFGQENEGHLYLLVIFLNQMINKLLLNKEVIINRL